MTGRESQMIIQKNFLSFFISSYEIAGGDEAANSGSYYCLHRKARCCRRNRHERAPARAVAGISVRGISPGGGGGDGNGFQPQEKGTAQVSDSKYSDLQPHLSPLTVYSTVLQFRSFSKSQRAPAFSSLSRDVFDCSELERGAYAAAQAQRFLAALPSIAGVGAASMNQRLLEQRLNKLIEQLVQRIRARLSAIFSAAISASASANTWKAEDAALNDAAASGSFPSRAFSHCLRALVALSKGDVAEEVVAETVTCPLAKILLTQGRVDGVGGRGSYLGLQSALESLASQVMAALVQPLKAFSETFPNTATCDFLPTSSSGHKSEDSVSSVSTPIDFIVNGVWLPVATMLEEKFPGMFSVGIAGTLSRCYMAVGSFVAMLEKSDSTSSVPATTKGEFAAHPAIAHFHNHWKLDLYLQVCDRRLLQTFRIRITFSHTNFSSSTSDMVILSANTCKRQLRTQEISSRLDRVCHLVEQHGLITKVLEDVYSLDPTHESGSMTAFPALSQMSVSGTPGLGAASGHAGAAYQSPSIALAPTLSTTDLKSLRSIDLSTIKHLNLSLSEAFCIEISTCLHPSVALKALSTRFFALSVRLVMRLEAHAAVMAEVATPSFAKANLTILIQQQQQRQLQNGGASSIPMTPISTPSKALATPASISSSLPSAQSSIASASVDDLVLLAFDLDTISSWLWTHFGPLAEKALGVPLGPLSDSPEVCVHAHLENFIYCLSPFLKRFIAHDSILSDIFLCLLSSPTVSVTDVSSAAAEPSGWDESCSVGADLRHVRGRV